MYPGMIQTAKAEGNKEAERTFNFANEVEKIHAMLYQQMLDHLEGAKES
jgi:rubrerythrin